MADPGLALRRVSEEDSALLFGWTNDPLTRRMSFAPEPIDWEEHVGWLERTLADPDCWLFLVVAPEGAPVGQIRFDREGRREAAVSLSIAREQRGRGLASAAIRLGVEEMRRAFEVAVVHAYIKPENTTSIRVFSRAGFGAPQPVRYRGSDALRMSRGPADKTDETPAGGC